METFSQFQAETSSEKLGLVVIEAAKRLVGWELHSGSVYKLTSFTHSVISAITDTGVAVTAVGSLGAVTAGKYYHDRAAQTLYLRTSDSVDPGTKFTALTFKLFFANAPVKAPHDLGSGFHVEWLPYFQTSSSFSLEVDNQNQLGTAIDGEGTITLLNDLEFWRSRYEKLTFENQAVSVYSWNRQLPYAEAKLVFRGRIYSKAYSPKQIRFTVKDLLSELRSTVELANVEDATYSSSYGGGGAARVAERLRAAKKRTVYGHIRGFRPINIDQVLTGYPLQGTFTVTTGSDSVSAGGSHAITHELCQGDEITFEGDSESYTISAMTGATAFTLSEEYEGSSGSKTATVKYRRERYTVNRVFQVSGHALSRAQTTVVGAYSVILIEVADGSLFREGDTIQIGAVFRTIRLVSDNVLRLTQALTFFPAAGDIVYRAAVAQLYIDDRLLDPDTDYTVNAATGQITLASGGVSAAEVSVAPIRKLSGTVSFTSGSRTVTGSGTSFTKELNPGDWIVSPTGGDSDWRMVWSIAGDESLTLSQTAPATASGTARNKSPDYYQESRSVLSCDVYGKTSDGTTSGALLRTAPMVVKDLLTTAGLSGVINTASFETAAQEIQDDVAIAIPAKYTETRTQALREIINTINTSVFGLLFQNSAFQLEYGVVSPGREATNLELSEKDILSLSVSSQSSQLASQVAVEYQSREYSPTSKAASVLTYQATSEIGAYLTQAGKENTVATVLQDQDSARMAASRWVFLQEQASSNLRVGTKLQAAHVEINQPVIITHEKLYERLGATVGQKIGLVRGISRTVTGTELEIDDLGNSFTRCATITPDTASDFVDATGLELLAHGYITAEDGTVGSDVATFGKNVIW